MTQRPQEILVLLLPEVHLQDFAGPVQAFHEAARCGAGYRLRYVGLQDHQLSAQGLQLAGLEPLPHAGAGQRILVPGMESGSLSRLPEHVPVDWLRQARAAGAHIASICSGAFVLGLAGLLDGRRCTTHWKLTARLQSEYPRAQVLHDRLFVHDQGITTSAGVVAGIDLALAVIEEDHGPVLTARVAREMVVFMRRDGSWPQRSIYLDFRTHLHPAIHQLQDWMVANPGQRATIGELAAVARLSPRHLTRLFRQATGITLKDYATRLRLEVAGTLLNNPELTVSAVAERCGFKDPRQLRRQWQKHYGMSPSAWAGDYEARH